MAVTQHQPHTNHVCTLSRAIGLAFWRAIKSQCHRRMIFALFVPLMVTIVLANLLLWFGWAPLKNWLSLAFTESTVLGALAPLISTTVFLALKSWLIPLAAFIMLMPVVGIVGLVVSAIWVMPMVLSHIGRRDYPDIIPEGRHAVVLSVWNVIWVGVFSFWFRIFATTAATVPFTARPSHQAHGHFSSLIREGKANVSHSF